MRLSKKLGNNIAPTLLYNVFHVLLLLLHTYTLRQIELDRARRKEERDQREAREERQEEEKEEEGEKAEGKQR